MGRGAGFLPTGTPTSRAWGQTQQGVPNSQCPSLPAASRVPPGLGAATVSRKGGLWTESSRFSATAAHPGPLPFALLSHTTASPARPALGASTLCHTQRCPQHRSLLPNPAGPSPSHPPHRPALPTPPSLRSTQEEWGAQPADVSVPLEPQQRQHSPEWAQGWWHSTLSLAPAPGVGRRWPQAPGARGRSGNRQQLAWWQKTLSLLTLQTLGGDTFIALPRP